MRAVREKLVASILLIVFAASLVAPLATPSPVGIPILVDLSHRQPIRGLDTIIRMVPEAQWHVLVKTREDADALPAAVKDNAIVIVGDFSTVDLGRLRIVMVIIGQPQAPLTPEEVAALAKWFKAAPGRVIWVAADSDYPAGGSELSKHVANAVLEAVGARIRVDFSSVEDTISNAHRTYRVLGFANVSEVVELRYAVDRVLFHGPGPIAWIDEAGRWRKLTTTEKPPRTYIIATTSRGGKVVEHQAEPRGTSGKAYRPGDTGTVTLMAAEFVAVEKGHGVVIASGESPYGAYQPMATWMYYGERISGPQFIRNVILWSTGYLGELKEYAKLATLPDRVKLVEAVLSRLKEDVKTTIAGLSSTLNVTQALAVAALILAIVALVLPLIKKPKAEAKK